MVDKISRQEHEEYCRKILEKAKSTIRAFAMDQDGTIKGGSDINYKKADVVELVLKIAEKGKYPIVITASGVTALKSFSSLETKNLKIPVFIGIGNGSALYRFDENGKTEIYNNKLSLEKVKSIMEIWNSIYSSLNIKESELQAKGVENFREFIDRDWQGEIPQEYVDIFKQHNGRCFCEEIKVTVVFPDWDETKQRELVNKFQESLDKTFGADKYLASRGDEVYLHITNNPGTDPKLFALQKATNLLGLTKEQVAAFGDMPFDNDNGLLIQGNLPYSFTNVYFDKNSLEKPPFILPGSSESQVGSVHKAIEYLLS